MLLKSTTRHVRIFTADVVNTDLQFHPNKLTLDLDPDNEFIWEEESIKKINDKFFKKKDLLKLLTTILNLLLLIFSAK